MKYMRHLPPKHCLFFHSWEVKKDTGVNLYRQCRHCGGREQRQKRDGYQPTNTDWVLGLSDDL